MEETPLFDPPDDVVHLPIGMDFVEQLGGEGTRESLGTRHFETSIRRSITNSLCMFLRILFNCAYPG